MVTAPQNILIAHGSFLGDVVIGTAVCVALKTQWPACRITMLVRPQVAPVLAGHPDVDAVLVDDKRGVDRGLRGLLHAARAVRAGRFDVALGEHRSLRSAVVLALAGVPLRIGFQRSEGAWLYHRTARRDPAAHDIQRQLSLLEPLGIDVAPLGALPRLRPAAPARRSMQRRLRDAGVGSTTSLVAIAPGSVSATKQWTVEGFAAVARALEERGDRVVYVGAASEVGVVEAVRVHAGCGISWAGQTDTGELAAFIDAAAAVVSNDSAPLHMAQALRRPVVGIFGPTNERLGFTPWSPLAAMVEDVTLECRPCGGGAVCPLGTHACMRNIGADRVVAALARVRAMPVG